MNSRPIQIAALLPFCLLLASCDAASGATDGVVMRCQEAASRQPDSKLDPDKDCVCAAKKLKGFLLEDHYAVLERYNTLITEIAKAQPQLRGLESHDRTLAALADELGISVDEANSLLTESVPFSLVRLAEQVCAER